MTEPVTIIFYGYPTLSKKNQYRACVGTSKAGAPMARMVKDRKLNVKLEHLMMQVDAAGARNLKLLHPSITFRRFLMEADLKSDRTGSWQTIEDVLVQTGVLVDDSDKVSNGRIIMEPSVILPKGQEHERRVEVTLS